MGELYRNVHTQTHHQSCNWLFQFVFNFDITSMLDIHCIALLSKHGAFQCMHSAVCRSSTLVGEQVNKLNLTAQIYL